MKSNASFSSEKQYYPSTVYYYSHARYALVSALKVLNIRENDKVALPELICHDLLASLVAVNAIPVYYPVNVDLEPDLSSKKFLDIKAIIVVNYFGFVQDLSKFEKCSKATGATLIEDNAHGFLSKDENGKLLGTRTGIGILSLRKTFPIPDGAALLIGKQYFNNKSIESLNCADSVLSKAYRLKVALEWVQKISGIRLRSYSELLIRFIRKLRTGHALPLYSEESEKVIPGVPEIHCESIRMLKNVSPGNEVERRRQLYLMFHAALSDFSIEPLFPDLPCGVSPFGYPFRANEADANDVVRFAHKIGFSCAPWPDLPIAIEPKAPVYYKNIWWVNFLC